MELEELKKAWKETTSEKQVKLAYDRSDLHHLLETKVRDTLKSVNRNMLSDALVMVGTVIMFIALVFIIDLKASLSISVTLAVAALVLLLHYRVKYILLNKPNLAINGISMGLRKIIKGLRIYITTYKIVLPLFAAALYIMALINIDIYSHGSLQWNLPFLTKAALSIPLSILMYYLTRQLVNRLYGKHLKRLEEVSGELG
ncbi:MAG: hypothetical protein AAFX87_27090 [Bacteroidota bacterium]